MDMLALVVPLSFATASISFTVTETKLFRPVREAVKRNSAFLGGLVSCGYCFGHWVSFGLVAVYHPRLFTAWRPLDYFLTALVVAWLGGIQWAFMCWLTEKSGK